MQILITGASSGIGESLARHGARRKHNLVLVARRKERLDILAEELISEHDISVEVIDADLTDDKSRASVMNRISRGDIDVLINNAGFGSSGPFVELDLDNEINEIDLNVRALVSLTHCALVPMVEKGYGTVVNISSIASYQPMSGNAVYGATKAFVTSFSHAIREELSERGVNVMVVCPGPTQSEFFERSAWQHSYKKSDIYPALLWQTADDVAKATFRGIDHQQGVVIPGLSNKFLAALSSSLPGSVTRKITAIVAKGRRLR